MKRWMVLVWLTGWLLHAENLPAETIPQPLAQQVRRLAQAMAFLGVPFHSDLSKNIEEALQEGSMADLDRLLETRILFHVTINPESKVSVRQGKAEPLLHQRGYRPFLVKVINQAVTTAPLSVSSPQAGPVYGGMTALSARRMQRESLHELEDPLGDPERFIDVTFYEQAPMTQGLSSFEVEFKLLWIYTHRSGLQEATFTFDVGQGTQDIGFRADIPILFRADAPVDLTLQITEADGTPSTARLVFRDRAGHVFPPQAKRLAPDFYFQEQIYRHHGQHLSLPAGDYTLESSRGPEYLVTSQNMTLPRASSHTLDIILHRWIQPSDYGFIREIITFTEPGALTTLRRLKVSNHRTCIFKSGEKGSTWAVCLPGDLALIFSGAFFLLNHWLGTTPSPCSNTIWRSAALVPRRWDTFAC